MKTKIIVKGPALSQSGYGEQTRFALRALRTREDIYDIYVHNLSWGHTSWLWEDTEERAWLDNLLLKTMQYLQAAQQQNVGAHFDIALQVTIPNEWEKLAPVNLGYTAGIETTRVAPGWIEKSFLMDEIIVPSAHSRDVYKGTHYEAENPATGEKIDYHTQVPVSAVNFPFKNVEASEINLDLDYDFNFLTVAQWSPRKNIDSVVKWFVEQFIDQEVGLVVKTSMANNCYADSVVATANLKAVLENPDYADRKCKVYILHGYLKEHEMAALYQHQKIKALISLTHGEGFGLPVFEAAGYGLPVITTEWSGPCDFLFAPVERKGGKKKNKALFSKVNYDMQPIQDHAVWDGVLHRESMWAYPQEGSAKMKFRDVLKNYDLHKKNAEVLSKHIKENWTNEKQYEQFLSHVSPYANIVEEEEAFAVDEWLSNLNVEAHE
jgi:glycosyltransferase involved in cell wall biosynthesis